MSFLRISTLVDRSGALLDRTYAARPACMRCACKYAGCMKTLQIRHVPDDVHRRLKARAAEEGMSLSELALAELRRSLDKPTRRELFERLERRKPVEVEGGLAAVVRAERLGR